MVRGFNHRHPHHWNVELAEQGTNELLGGGGLADCTCQLNIGEHRLNETAVGGIALRLEERQKKVAATLNLNHGCGQYFVDDRHERVFRQFSHDQSDDVGGSSPQ